MPEDHVNKLVCDLSQRADESRSRGRVFLLLIGFLLVASTVGFVLAGELSIGENKRSIQYRDAHRGIDLNDVISCGEVAVVVGDHGMIGLSTDGGEHWRRVDSQTDRRLRLASFSKNCKNVIVVGDDGTALYSVDGGGSWHLGDNLGTDDINALALSADGATAVAVGRDGVFMASYDGGATWRRHLVIGSADANDVALSENGRMVVVAGDDGLAHVLDRSESNEFAVSNRLTPMHVPGRSPDFDVALIVESRGKVRRFVLGTGVFEYDNGWQKRSDDRGIRDVTHRADCFISVGRSGAIWASSDGLSWSPVESVQGEHIYQIEVSGDGTRAVARVQDRGLLIGHRSSEANCEDEFEWSFQTARTDHSRIAHIDEGRFLVVGEKLDGTEDEYSVILSVDADSGGRPVNVGSAISRLISIPVNDVYDDEDVRGPIEMGVPAREVYWGELVMRGFLRIGVTAVFIFLAAHLFGLARYEFRLATYYAARKDVLELTDVENFSTLATIDQIDQLMRAMSPEHIEERASSSNLTVDHALQILRGVERRAR